MAETVKPDLIHVQVCIAKPDLQFLCDLNLPAGATLRQAIEQSKVALEIPGIDFLSCRVGIYGKLKTFDTILREHDRVEIYRQLIADPKESRRRRAEGKTIKNI